MDSAHGFCPRSQKSGSISSSLAPGWSQPHSLQVLNRHLLGGLLTSGRNPEPRGDSGTWRLPSAPLTGFPGVGALKPDGASWYTVGTPVLIGLPCDPPRDKTG